MKRVLILIHFASKLTRDNLAIMGKKVAPCVMANLDEGAGIFSSDIAFGFTGITSKDLSELHKTLVKGIGLKVGDNLSILELAECIISTHPGLMQWNNSTQMVSVLAGLAKQK